MAEADWGVIEEWLISDSPAKYDFLGNLVIAERLAKRLTSGTRSIGIVGLFGAGKTSIVKWIVEKVGANTSDDKLTLLITEHSCWGFEDSASSIHAMLAGAIGKVGEQVDTFYIGSLPESYRQMFSTGGEWINTISNLVLGKRDPIEQFSILSELLGDMNARLVFVVEDLDRNNSRSFDIQEVLAFLQQLKEFENISFILTGGLNAPLRIDFSKLCDHIEYLRPLDAVQSGALVSRLRQQCLDTTIFPHDVLSDSDQQKWTPSPWSVLLLEELPLPQAVATLLNTPRALRHALARTWHAWKHLFGEIDWDQLLAVNVLRSSAPECFSFLLRHWDLLHSELSPSQNHTRNRLERLRQSLIGQRHLVDG